MLACNLLDQISEFLSRELSFELRRAAKFPFVLVNVLQCLERDDIYYAILQPDKRLSEFEDGTWVKITKGGYSQYGSIWSSEESRPYLLTSEPVPLGSVQIVEADSIQLLQMQREAFSRLQNKSNPISERLSNIILKKGDLTRSSEIFSALSFYDRRVSENDCQAKAVKKALAESQRNMFFLIHGPPGTGKTTVITEIVKHLADTGRKVLITSHTNVAVNNVMENLALSEDYSSYLKSKMVRLGPKAKVSKILKDLVPTTHDELIKIAVSQIVGATLSKLSILVLNGKLSFDEPYFDTVIVDESSMATIPLTLAGILLGKTFILVGDHLQLPPITRTLLPPSCPKAKICGLCESMFRLLIEFYPERSQMLTVQFRSHPVIMGFSSKFVYERFAGRGIESAGECLQKKLKFEKVCQEQIEGTVNEKPVCYVDMHYEECPIEWYPSGPEIRQRHKRPSCFNELEATIALKIRHDLIKSGLPPERVWIITPFRLQRDIIKKAIRGIYGMVPEDTVISIYENLLASTVDSIQGKENDVIMYSLTWVPSVARERSVHKALKDVRRLNVALTRAKKKLIVIGDLAKLSWQYPYGPLKGYMNEHGAVVLAPEIRKDDDFLTVVRYYFGKKKNERIDEEVQRRFREAKKRIRKDVSVPPAKPRVWRVENENDFQSFKESDLWEDLSLESKRRIYEKRMMGKPFEVMEVYEGAGQNRAVYLKAYKQYGVFQKELLEFV